MTLEELRREKYEEAYMEEKIEVAMRNDDDYFYGAVTDEFSDRISMLMVEIENYCDSYDRDSDGWIAILLEK